MDYMSIVQELLKGILNNPVTWGMALMAIKKAIPILLQDIDNSGVEKSVESWLQPGLVALSALVSVGGLFLQGQLHTMDPNAVVQWVQTFVQTYLGAKATGVVNVQKIASKVKNG